MDITIENNSISKEPMFDVDLHGNKFEKSQQSWQSKDLLKKLKSWWFYSKIIHSKARIEALRDHDIYDGEQWDEDDAAEVRNRGQIPQVFNRIKPTCDWIIGSQKKSRVDFRVLPRTSDDAKLAEIKTQVLKYISDINNMQEERSHAFIDAVISGVGWIEVGAKNEDGEEPIFCDYEDWRNLWLDPLSFRRDLKDARFIFRRKRVDLDIACAMFPEHAGSFRLMGAYDNADKDESVFWDDETDLEEQIENKNYESGKSDRNRIELIECWYRTPQKMKVLRGIENIGVLEGKTFKEDNPMMVEMVENNLATTVDAIRMIVRYAIYSNDLLLFDKESPYNHNSFPFVPIWGFRKKKDNTSYGVVRNLRDPQDDLNKRRSKALFILATNQVIADNDAVEDWDELMDEVTRPDGLIRKKPNSELILNNDRNLAAQHVDLMAQDAEYIESTGGVTDEMMGRQTNAISGTAIEARQSQGEVTTSEIFDNLRVHIQAVGEILLSLIEQYYTDQKIIRITNDKGKSDFVEINKAAPTGDVLNDIASSQADFIVDSSTWNASIRQATFGKMMEMLGQMDSQIALNMLDLVIDLSDIPGKEDFVARIRELNGHSDPDADPNDIEEQAKREYQAQEAAKQQQIQDMVSQLEMEKLKSEIAKNNTSAMATEAGMEFDKEKLRIEKAKALHDIQSHDVKAEYKKDMIKHKDKVNMTKQGEYGIKSDNKK